MLFVNYGILIHTGFMVCWQTKWLGGVGMSWERNTEIQTDEY